MDSTEDRLRNQRLQAIVDSLGNAIPRIAGSFTLSAAATTVVPQTAISSNSRIMLQPTNAAAATLMAGAASLYVSAKTQGASFAVATANGASAAGTETFDYLAVTLV